MILTQEGLKSVSKEVHALTEAFREFSLMMKDVVRYTRTQEFVQSNASLTPLVQSPRESSRFQSGSKRSRVADSNHDEATRLTSEEASFTVNQETSIATGQNSIEALLNGREIPVIESLKKFTVQDLLVHWYEYEVFKASDIPCGTRSIKDKIKTVMKYITESIITTADIEQLSIRRPSEKEYLAYSRWRNQLRSIANSISERAFKTLDDTEQTIFSDKRISRSSNVTSIYERLMAIKQRQPEISVNREKNKTLDQFLLKKPDN